MCSLCWRAAACLTGGERVSVMHNSPTRGQEQPVKEQGGLGACLREAPNEGSMTSKRILGQAELSAFWSGAGTVSPSPSPSCSALPCFYSCPSSGWSIALACPGCVALLWRFGSLFQGMYKSPCMVYLVFLLSLTPGEAEGWA